MEVNQGSLKTWLIPGFGKGKYKMSLEHRVLPESQEVTKHYEAWVTRLSVQLEGAPTG